MTLNPTLASTKPRTAHNKRANNEGIGKSKREIYKPIAEGINTPVFIYSFQLPVFFIFCWRKYCSTSALRAVKKVLLLLLNVTLGI